MRSIKLWLDCYMPLQAPLRIYYVNTHLGETLPKHMWPYCLVVVNMCVDDGPKSNKKSREFLNAT